MPGRSHTGRRSVQFDERTVVMPLVRVDARVAPDLDLEGGLTS